MTVATPRSVTPAELGTLVDAQLRRGTHAGAAAGRAPLVVASGNCATPSVALRAIDEAVESYQLFLLNAHGEIPRRPGVVPTTPFVGPAMRGDPALRYLPCRLSLVPRLFAEACRPDVVVVHTSVPAGGRVSLGTEVNILPAAVEAARAAGGLVIAQMNRRMPYTYGDAELPVEAIDAALEVDLPLASPAPRPVDEVRAAIGERVAALVDDGATLQLGIGAVPDATLASLPDRRRLRIWTETFSDGVRARERAGALDPDIPLTTSFVLGSAELYSWVDRNRRVRLLRTESVNNPAEIARQPAMTSINTALQVDLHAQANASYVHGRIWSGFGGQPDFVSGALHAPGGHAIIALPSWHAKSATSTIVPALAEPTTSFQHSYVVSEHGAACLWGRTQHEQARALVDTVADPRARDLLADHLGGDPRRHAVHPRPAYT
jgi:acyl-CoA hydrolase